MGFNDDGWSLGWKDTGVLVIYQMASAGTILHTFTTAPAAGAGERYFIQLKQTPGMIGVRIYKWDETINAFPETPTEEKVLESNQFPPSQIYIGTFLSSGNPTAVSDFANMYSFYGSNPGNNWGPVGVHMKSGTVDSGVAPVTNSNLWYPSSGLADSGTATGAQADATHLKDTSKAWGVDDWITDYEMAITGGDGTPAIGIVRDITGNTADTLAFATITSIPDAGTTTYQIYPLTAKSAPVAELVPDDTDYLSNRLGFLGQLAYFSVANGIISGTPNILAVQAGVRFALTGDLTKAMRMRMNGSSNTLAKSMTAYGNAGVIQHHFVCTSRKPGTSTDTFIGTGEDFSASDIDNLEIGASVAGSASTKIYSLYCTVCYGNDEPYAKVYVQDAQKTKGNTGPLTLTLNAGIEGDRAVLCQVAYDVLASTDYDVPASEYPTYNGKQMTLLQATTGTPGYLLFYLCGESGSNTLSFPNNTSKDVVVTALSLYNVDQVTPFGAVDTDTGTGSGNLTCSTASPRGGLSVGGIAYTLLSATTPTVTVVTLDGAFPVLGQPGSHLIRVSDQQGLINDVGGALSTRWAQEDGTMNYNLSGVTNVAWKSWAVGVNYATRPGSSAP
jgi:hypothetical protein